jgi:hypothetical protein
MCWPARPDIGYNRAMTVNERQVLPVAGATALPTGFWHPHASEQARIIAEAGMILRVQVGSGAHGTALTGQDDRDEMGVCLEPPQFVTGLARVPNGIGGQGPSVRFEQYERHTRGIDQAGWRTGPGRATSTSSSIQRESGGAAGAGRESNRLAGVVRARAGSRRSYEEYWATLG